MGVKTNHNGFTLIELSIVLVIIGLLIGGILFGKDMIKSSEQRALLAQMNQYRTAINSFKEKYGQLPGDMHVSKTAQLGFFTFVGVSAGVSYGNSNGLIFNGIGELESFCSGEGSIVFRHLAEAGVINMKLEALESWTGYPQGETTNTPFTQSKYLLPSKAGNGYFCSGVVGSSPMLWSTPSAAPQHNNNAFTIHGPVTAATSSTMMPSMSPIDLYSIDLKVDDGLPVSGKVLNTTIDFGNSGIEIYWNATSTGDNTYTTTFCTYGGANAYDSAQLYNANPSTNGNSISCQPVFVW